MIVKDYYNGRGWMYFLKDESDAPTAFKRFLAICDLVFFLLTCR